MSRRTPGRQRHAGEKERELLLERAMNQGREAFRRRDRQGFAAAVDQVEPLHPFVAGVLRQLVDSDEVWR